MEKKNYILFDISKFICSLIIVIFHYNIFVVGNNINGLIGGGGYRVVEVFFVISGYLLFVSLRKQKSSEVDICRFISGKVKRIYLSYLIALIATFIIRFIIESEWKLIIEFIKELFLAQEWLPVFPGLTINGPAWYISAMFVSMLFICLVYKHQNEKCRTIISISVACCYLGLFIICKSLGVRGFAHFVPIGIMRAVAGMGMGTLAAFYKEKYETAHPDSCNCWAGGLIVWAISLLLLIAECALVKDSIWDFMMIPLMIVFVLSASGVQKNSSALICTAAKWLGKISLYIYLSHTFIRYFLGVILGQFSLKIYLVFSLLFAIIWWLIMEAGKRVIYHRV